MSDCHVKIGDEVSWLNAYGDREHGTVTKVGRWRVHVDMVTIGGKPRARVADVFFDRAEWCRLVLTRVEGLDV